MPNKDRLLEYHVSEGWEPLCKFLEVEEPEDPFPEAEGDDVESFREASRKWDELRLWSLVGTIGIPFLVSFVTTELFIHYRQG